MAFGLKQNQAIYQKTEVFDTPGNHTWTHPLPGQNIEVFVEMIGAGGGAVSHNSASSGTAAGNGGDTIWDTASEALTVTGGTGATDSSTPGDGFIKGGNWHHTAGSVGLTAQDQLFGGRYGNGGYIHATDGHQANGGSGTPKTFSRIVSGDINLTVGSGGTSTTSNSYSAINGQHGAIIISYNITTTQTPVVVNMQRRDWEHFGEISWRTTESSAGQSISANTLTTLTLDTELLDTGNKVSVAGNVMTMEAGTYEFDAHVPSSDCTDYTVRLYNQSDSALISSHKVVYLGNAGRSSDGGGFKGVFNLPSQKDLRLEFVCAGGPAVIGRSAGNNVTTSDLVDRTKFQFKWRP
jgi:hypothetical protein